MDREKLNILFYCRTKRTKIMVHLAKVLQDMGYLYNASAFVAYYDEWKDYLKRQRLVKFDRIYGSDEIFQKMPTSRLNYSELRRFERMYGDQEIWNIVYTEERISPHLGLNIHNHPKYSKKDIYLYIQLCFQAAEKILDEVKPDCIIDFAAVNAFRGILDLVARHRNIPYLWPSGAVVLGDRFFIAKRGWDTYEDIKKSYFELIRNQDSCSNGWQYLNEFRKDPSGSSYSNYLPLNVRKRKKVKLKPKLYQILKILYSILLEIHLRVKAIKDPKFRYNFQLYKSLPSIRFYRYFLGKIRAIYLSIIKPFKDSPLLKDYAFMTLHLQPEASTSVKSPFFVNEVSFIENVSRVLPLHWKLVVKPHPRMTLKKPFRFYKTISKMPNIQLVSPTANTFELIKNSRAVVAITGTSGFEGLLLGKKVIVTGNTPWNVVKGVTICRDFAKMHSAFKEAENYIVDENHLAAYLQAVHNCTFSFNKNIIWGSTFDLNNEKYRGAVKEMAGQLMMAYRNERP